MCYHYVCQEYFTKLGIVAQYLCSKLFRKIQIHIIKMKLDNDKIKDK